MIQIMQMQDPGTYICRAENQVGQPQAAIATVDIVGKSPHPLQCFTSHP